MYNWSVDEEQFKQADPEGYEIWKLEQMINYDEAGEKLDARLVKDHWGELRGRLDVSYREFLELLLWPNKQIVS